MTVVFITNESRACAINHMRVGEGLVVWDYHVLMVTRDDQMVFDLDTTLGLPCPVKDYWHYAFPVEGPKQLFPRFRLVEGADFLKRFRSDRAHMKHPETGNWLQPPPPWSPILGEGDWTLEQLLASEGLISQELALAEINQV